MEKKSRSRYVIPIVVGALAGFVGGLVLYELYRSLFLYSIIPGLGVLAVLVGAAIGAIAGIIFGNKEVSAVKNALLGGIGGSTTAVVYCAIFCFYPAGR